MPCCGGNRSQSLARLSQDSAARTPSATVVMEYTGKTGLTVIGVRSGKLYRFDQPGARVQVDMRDLPVLHAVPHLKRL